jgi:hypothetical protein
MKIGERVRIIEDIYSGNEWRGVIVGRSGIHYHVEDENGIEHDVQYWQLREFEDYELKLEACDLIEELLKMLRSKTLTQKESDRLDEIEDFSVNHLGED